MIRSVCVYCASSSRSSPVYLDAAGWMGRLAAAALDAGGKVIGVLPRFMDDLEWGNRALTELRIVDDMHERKRVMLELSDAVIALPGGCGTLEELFEAITWKRLGLFSGAIVMVNTLGFYTQCAAFLESCIERRFMD